MPFQLVDFKWNHPISFLKVHFGLFLYILTDNFHPRHSFVQNGTSAKSFLCTIFLALLHVFFMVSAKSKIALPMSKIVYGSKTISIIQKMRKGAVHFLFSNFSVPNQGWPYSRL